MVNYFAGLALFFSLWFEAHSLWNHDSFALIVACILGLTNLAILIGDSK